MTAVNHALTGAVIGFVVSNPLIALPAALLSHFACDVLPHFDLGGDTDKRLRLKLFRRILYVDMLLCVVLALTITIAQPHHWWLAVLCAITATLPDMVWLPYYLQSRKGKSIKLSQHWFVKFSTYIQWFARPIGAFVEVAWFVAGVIIVGTFLH